MHVSLKSNIKEFTKHLDYIQYKQVPFATSRALNDVAVDAQTEVVQGIGNTFDNKKKWWLKQQPTGIKVKFSNKRNLIASVFTNVYFANRQEKGGTKTPKRGKNLAVPTNYVPKKYRISHGAKDMMNERKNVFATSKGIFQRTSKKRYPIRLLWSLTRSSFTKPRFAFYATCQATVKKNFAKHFQNRLQQALKSARR
jgi:hypothetical protein